MAQIRILFTIPNFHTSGSGKALLNLAKRLDPQVFEPHIMCLHNRGDYFKIVEDSGIPVHVYNYLSASRPITKLLNNCWAVSRKFKDIAPAIIHSFNYSADYSEALAARLAGIPWVFTKKNMSWGGASNNAWLLRSWLAAKIVLQNTDMKKQFYPKSKKTVLIPRGVDVNFFASHSKTCNAPEGIENEKRYIICVANMVPVKGVELLIEAYHTLKNLHSEWRLLIVGDTSNSYGQFLKERMAELSLDNHITFTGKVPDVRPYLNMAEIFVLPTKDEGRREGSPVALLEAMAAGKTVIGSEIPGIKDQLAEFPDALFKAGNVKDLSDKLDILMRQSKNDLLVKGLVFKGFVEKNLTIEHELARHEQLCKTIVE